MRLYFLAGQFLISFNLLFGQFYFYNDEYFDSPVLLEVGVSPGVMNCLTDLGGRNRKGSSFVKDVNWRAARFCAGLYASLQYNNIAGLRFECTIGSVSGADSLLSGKNSGAAGRYARNLSFHSRIREATLVVELYPLSLPELSANGPPLFSPYLFAGIGLFSFRPQALLNNQPIDLPALHTEGQGFPEYPARKMYDLKQWNLPAGIGMRYESSARTVLRFECTYRKLWTDYLDDVSGFYIDPKIFTRHLDHKSAATARAMADRNRDTPAAAGQVRGNDKNSDAYFSFNLKLAFVLGRKKR